MHKRLIYTAILCLTMHPFQIHACASKELHKETATLNDCELSPDITHTSPLSSIEYFDDFFSKTLPSSLIEVWVTKEDNNQHKIKETTQGEVIKVHSKFQESYPEGTYIFYIKPDTGGYENAMIFTGKHSGLNKISGTYASFYIPKIGQITGNAKIYVYIPGFGVGITSIKIKYPD